SSVGPTGLSSGSAVVSSVGTPAVSALGLPGEYTAAVSICARPKFPATSPVEESPLADSRRGCPGRGSLWSRVGGDQQQQKHDDYHYHYCYHSYGPEPG